MVFSLGVFAASVDMGAKGSLQLNPQGNKDNKFTIGQTDITLSASNKNIAFNYVSRIDSASGAIFPAPATKYAWVEGKIFGGMGQVGLISPIVDSTFGGGFYSDSTFSSVAGVNMYGAGACWMTGPWTVAYTGAASLLKGDSYYTDTAKGKLGVAYNTCDTGKVGLIMVQDKTVANVAGKIDYSLYVQKAMSFGALDLSAQIMWALQTQSTVSGLGKQLVAVYANYALDKTQSVYCTFVDDLADVNAVNSLSLGYELAVNDSVKTIVDYTDAAGSGQNVTVGLNFVL